MFLSVTGESVNVNECGTFEHFRVHSWKHILQANFAW